MGDRLAPVVVRTLPPEGVTLEDFTVSHRIDVAWPGKSSRFCGSGLRPDRSNHRSSSIALNRQQVGGGAFVRLRPYRPVRHYIHELQGHTYAAGGLDAAFEHRVHAELAPDL